jgi:hypothetical protein
MIMIMDLTSLKLTHWQAYYCLCVTGGTEQHRVGTVNVRHGDAEAPRPAGRSLKSPLVTVLGPAGEL